MWWGDGHGLTYVFVEVVGGEDGPDKRLLLVELDIRRPLDADGSTRQDGGAPGGALGARAICHLHDLAADPDVDRASGVAVVVSPSHLRVQVRVRVRVRVRATEGDEGEGRRG